MRTGIAMKAMKAMKAKTGIAMKAMKAMKAKTVIAMKAMKAMKAMRTTNKARCFCAPARQPGAPARQSGGSEG